MNSLPSQALKAIKAYIILAFLAFDCIIAALLIARFISGRVFSFLIIGGFGLFCLFYFCLAEKYCSSLRYSCRFGRLAVTKGIFFRRHTVIRGDAVGYVKAYSDPVLKHFSLCALIFFCPGSGAVLLSPVKTAEAKRIKELLRAIPNQGQSV